MEDREPKCNPRVIGNLKKKKTTGIDVIIKIFQRGEKNQWITALNDLSIKIKSVHHIQGKNSWKTRNRTTLNYVLEKKNFESVIKKVYFKHSGRKRINDF